MSLRTESRLSQKPLPRVERDRETEREGGGGGAQGRGWGRGWLFMAA
jgi:hypothetical protein